MAGLIAELPDGTVVTDPDILASYRQDRALDPERGHAAGRRPAAAHRGRAGRAALGHRPPGRRSCRAARAPGCPAGRPRSTAASCCRTEKMRDITVDPVTRTAVVQPGLLNAEVKNGGRRARAVVPAGPVVVRDLQHRRQHRHQRRRAVLREVRRHHRLRARPAGGAGRRHRGAARRPATEGRRRAVA